jgi:predicted PurR-regulated permease PerM
MVRKLLYSVLFRYVFALFVVCALIYLLSPFHISLILASIFSLALNRFVNYLVSRHWRRSLASLLAVCLFSLIIIIPITLSSARLTQMASEASSKDPGMASKLPQRFETAGRKALDKAQAMLPEAISKRYNIRELVESRSEQLKASAFQGAKFLLASIPIFLLEVLIFVLCLYVFLLQAAAIKSYFQLLFRFPPGQGRRFLDSVQDACYTSLLSNILTGILQASIVSLGALIFGFEEFSLIFSITFFVSFIPVIGAAPVACLLAIVAFFDNNMGAGIGLLATAALAGASDNFARPFLFRGRAEIHPLLAFLTVLGGVYLLGLPGLFAGPLVGALAVHSLPILLEGQSSADDEDSVILEEDYASLPQSGGKKRNPARKVIFEDRVPKSFI